MCIKLGINQRYVLFPLGSITKSQGGEECPKIKGRKSNWIGHILRRKCLLKHVTERKIKGRVKVTGRRGRRRKKLLNYLTKYRG